MALKILIVNTHFEDTIGGSELQCDIIAEGLHDRGYEVTYLAIDKKKEYNRPYKIIGTERSSTDIAEKILKIRPDVLYWRFNKRFFYKSVKPASMSGIKVIFAVSNIKDLLAYNIQWQGPLNFINIMSYFRKSLLSRINHLGFKYVDALTVNNEEHIDMADMQIRRYIPNAITDKKRDFFWKNPFILWVANIKDRKRPELFVELANRLVEYQVDLLMIGNIQDNQYNWIADGSNTPSNFYYLGPKEIDEVNGAISKSLFIAATSTPEGFSNNIIQAWLQKKPVVAYEFDPGGMIAKHSLGFVCNSSFELFVNKSCELILNKEMREQLGEKAYLFAKENFSTNKTIDKIETLIKDVIQ